MIDRDTIAELAQSRIANWGDVHFYAVESRRKIEDFLTASDMVHKGDSPLAVGLSHARFMMAGAVQSLYDALQKDGAYPTPEKH